MEFILRTDRAAPIERALREAGADLHIPALCDVEMAAALRRGLLAGVLSEDRAREALQDYLDLPLTRYGHQSLLDRVVALRHNFSAYDATYVALAELIGGELLTADASLANAAREQIGLNIRG